MKQTTDKVHGKQKLLLETFLSGECLSIKEICELLGCNRQSAYNYIKRLEKNGYSLEKKKQGNETMYSLIKNESPVDLLYDPVTPNVLRKYLIVQELQDGPVKKEELQKRFTVGTDEEKKAVEAGGMFPVKNRILIDAKMTKYYQLIEELVKDGEVEAAGTEQAEQKYYLTGKGIPLQMLLDYNSLYDLNIELSTAAKGTAYYEQLESIYLKTSVLLGIIDEDIPYYNNYFVYGKKMNGLSAIAEKLQPFQKVDYKNKVLEISHKTKAGDEVSVLFAVGKIVYNTEKDVLYLMGKDWSKKGEKDDTPYIINASTITEIKESMIENECYQSEQFNKLFDDMFSISAEPPVDVKIEFERVANVERKVRYLSSQRQQSTIQMEEDKIIYTDTISGLSDFAMYLRRFGRSVRVMEPRELKEKLDGSVDRALERYKEVLTDGSI